ncbi:MAG: hypothetical protein HQL56_09020 [Magnetococcales bacterium]|nr:hypothetical protein [Magnetococcales bacterium]
MSGRRKGRSAVMGGLLLLAGATAWADHPLFDQKTQLLDRYLTQSVTTEQVDRLGDVPLKEALSQTRKLREEARQAHDAGDLDKAMMLIDQALKEAVRLSQMAAGPAKQAWNQRVRFEGLLAGVATFEEAYRRNLQLMMAEKGPGVTPPVNPDEIRQTVAKAWDLAGQGEHAKANELLFALQQNLIAALKKMLDSKTLVYQLKFENPQQEYRYEVDRMQGFEALLNMALTRAKINEDGRRFIQERLEKSRAYQQEAEKLAVAGQYAEAIKALENGNEDLSNAMRMAGIVFP